MNISQIEFLSKLNNLSKNHKGDTILLASSEEEAQNFYSEAKFFTSNIEILYLPSFDSLPYDRVSPAANILSLRAYCLSRLKFSIEPKILITAACNILLKYPSPDELLNGYREIRLGEKTSSTAIENFLLHNGYTRTSCAMDVGEFSRRGDILDVVLFSNEAFRINFGWDHIESIKIYDAETQISNKKINKFEIYQASELILNETNIENYKANFLKLFGIGKAKELYFEKITEGIKVPGIESVAPLFYSESFSLFDYLNNPQLYSSNLIEQSIDEFLTEFNDFYQSRKSTQKTESNFYPAADPSYLIFNKNNIAKLIENKTIITLQESKDYYFLPNFSHISQLEQNQATPLKLFTDFCKSNPNKKPIITASSTYSLEKIKGLLLSNEVAFVVIKNFAESKKNIINLAITSLNKGIVTNDVIIATEIEILGEKKFINPSSKKRLKNIFKELESFNEGDLVVHIQHGIGKYESIEQVEVDNVKHDCLKIIYAKGDKLFIPVENISVLKKYGNIGAELDYLGGVSWQRRTAKLKDRIGELAQNLMKLAASRKTAQIEPIHFSSDDYKLFCDKFPYVETEDQQRTADEILSDLQGDKPMDRLICGDVGFGKTEIAMRAAFLVANDKIAKKQVAIIVPTTILARQHYNNFIERFKGFNIKIKQLSRFVTVTETKKTKEAIKNGDVDIIIGTHALLATDIKFTNLGLVIVDEEQHFGVLQKEKLKELKDSVHSLTLTATPIPRTLQMSLLGIKDLSLIATPPIDRLSVRTSLISYDEVIIRDALLREKFRGGKSFFVCPRVSDLGEIAANLKEFVPEVSVKTAHGKLAASSIDDIMTDFYEGKFDVLLSTAIVESGLDIPAANTMIIYKAEHFGLSQLYQLRGRVGRAKIRGYSYLVLQKNKMPTKNAVKRLEIMQSLDSLGAGFSIASHDMDIRGFGNLVGDEQSGHIKEVGAELYQEMLEEAIAIVKNEKIISNEMPIVKINVPVFIPEDYITDQNLRLSIYRRAGDLFILDEVEEFKNELTDRFGVIPEPVNNLLEIIKIKIICKTIGIAQLDLGSNGFNVKFTSEINSDKVINFLAKYPRHTKVKPDNKLIFIKNLQPNNYLEETKNFISNFS